MTADTIAALGQAVEDAAEAGIDPETVLGLTVQRLDIALGGPEIVVHTTGEWVDSVGQLCVRCGTVLVASANGAGWSTGAHLAEPHRWRRPTSPRTHYPHPEGAGAPGHRWCDDG